MTTSGLRSVPAAGAPRPGAETERELVRQCVAGDTAAWRALYDRHFPPVERLVTALGVSGSEADDLCQEIFIIIHRYLPRFRGESRLGTWIYRLATREAIRFARKQRLRRAMAALFSRERRAAQPNPAWSDSAAARQHDLQKMLDRLAPERRLALVMFEIEGLPVGEIARICDCAENTIWTRLHRARGDLAKMVEAAR